MKEAQSPAKKKSERPKRYSISVTGAVYERLRSTVTSASLQKFVDKILESALDDPATLARIADKCRSR